MSAVISTVEPEAFAYPLAISTYDCSGNRDSGAAIVTSAPSRAAVTRSELATLLRPSPAYTSLIPAKVPNSSLIVIKSPIICVGCQSSVRPFQTGTPECSASSSTTAWLAPLNSRPSNMLPKILAVSATDSFLPSWISPEPRNSGAAPRSFAATVKAARVRVEDFSNSNAIFCPFKY